jgi:hypothetical protein
MNTQPCGPDEAFARDLAELDRELEARTDPEMPEKTVSLLAGLVAGMAQVGGACTMTPAQDTELADLMMQLVGLDLTSADGRAGAGSILREIEAKAPGTIARMQSGLALRRAGASLLAEGRPDA